MRLPKRLAERLLVIVPSLIYIGHALLFRNWIIDDAGISFAYARNLAHGFGLVSQPGVPPVEGYSNPAWVLMLAGFFVAGGANIVLAAKVLSAILVLASFVCIEQILRRASSYPRLATLFVLTMLAANTSFVVWTISGLENALYVSAVIALVWRCAAETAEASTQAIQAGLLASLCALTRPDGVVYAIVFPILAIAQALKSRLTLATVVQRLALYGAPLLLIAGGYEVFRLVYFKDWLPNTYYAKVGFTLFSFVPPTSKLSYLLQGAALSPAFAELVLALLLYVALRAGLDAARVGLLATLAASIAIYMILPSDWMPELRFATPVYPSLYALLFLTGESLRGILGHKRVILALLAAVSILFVVASARAFAIRSLAFVRAPDIPFSEIAEQYGIRFSDYADRLGMHGASILLPDVGGTLFYGRLRVYDLGGLTDRTIARTIDTDRKAFFDYVFNTAKPTFIHTHGIWTYAADLEADPRFRADYAPIDEYVDDFVLSQTGRRMYSGDYVRKDALTAGNLDQFKLIQAAAAAAPR